MGRTIDGRRFLTYSAAASACVAGTGNMCLTQSPARQLPVIPLTGHRRDQRQVVDVSVTAV